MVRNLRQLFASGHNVAQFAFAFTFACTSVCLAQDKLRTWTSADGKHQQQAKLVKVDGDDITLENQSGKQIELKLSRLSKADHDYIKGLAAKPKPGIGKGRLTKIERSSIFARDILATYQSELAVANPEDRKLLESKIAEFERLAKTGSIRFGNRFVAEAEVAKYRAEAEAIVKDWFENAQGMNSRVRLSELERVKQVDPISIDAAVFLGLHYMFYERDYDTATKHFKDAVNRGTRYESINGTPEKQNLICAFNNLALLEIRSNNPARACDHWNRAADIEELLNRQITSNIAKAGRFLDAQGQFGLSGSNSVRKRYIKLVSRTKTVNGSRNGWFYLLPVAQNGEPYQRSDFLVGFDGLGVNIREGYLEDKVCLQCEGKGILKCNNPSCKKGYVTTVEAGKVVWNGKQFVPQQPITRVNPCGNCKTTQQVKCWACGSSGEQHRK